MVQQVSSSSLASAFLFQRLKWPVPMSRWRTAKEIRNLIHDPLTRSSTTDALLDYLGRCKTESEVCELLAIVFLTSSAARPSRMAVVSHIQCPSILADMILERTYGPGSGIGGWHLANSGRVPEDFIVDSYFETHKTSHVPPIFLNDLDRLERYSGRPFVLRWAYEWKTLRDKLATSYTGYPYYFGSSLDVRSGIKGQYWQRMRDVYLSAYLRTLAHAVSEWRMPQRIAEESSVNIVHGVAGLFDVEPSVRPEWLANFPERVCAPGADFLVLVRDLIRNAHLGGMRLVSLDTPVALSVHKYAKLTLSAHLVTPDYEMPDNGSLDEITLILSITDTFELKGPLTEKTMEEASTKGVNGTSVSVCCRLFPDPFGMWQSDYLHVGLKIAAPYIAHDSEVQCTNESINSIMPDGRTVSQAIIWNDDWVPEYPGNGTTRCGTSTMIDSKLLDEAIARSGRKLAFFLRLRTWERESDYGAYSRSESKALVTY